MRPDSTHLLLVRHGEVAAAHHGTFYGGAEVPLSARGEADTDAAAARLAERRPQRVCSSPLARACRLAEPLAAGLGLAMEVVADLRELDRGAWTHLHRDAIEAGSPGALARYLQDPEGAAAPGGERESVFAQRVWNAVDGIVAASPGARIVVVCHGHVIRVVMRRLLGWDGPTSLTRMVPYLGVVELESRPDGEGRLLAWPETALPEALRVHP